MAKASGKERQFLGQKLPSEKPADKNNDKGLRNDRERKDVRDTMREIEKQDKGK